MRKKKLMALSLCVAMTASLCACGNSTTTTETTKAEETTGETTAEAAGETSAAAGEATDGTYTATEKGFGGDVTVTITVENGELTKVDIQGANETANVGGAAMPELQAAMESAKSPEVDSVSGATVTSEAVKKAALSCFEQAGLSYDQKEVAKGEDVTADADVLVIGLGASGTMAAIGAAENGATVIGVEATDTIGGMGNAAQGMFAIGTDEQKERYGEDLPTDEEYWFNKIMEENRYLGNGALVSEYVNESANTVQYLQDKGVNVYLSDQPQMIGHFDTMVEYHRWNNAEPFKYLTQAMEDAGVDIHMNTTAQSLLTDSEGNVTGAVCTQEDGSTLTVNAKAVIVATGSFAGNEELMRKALGNAYDNCMVIKGADLPGLDMMWNVGAAEGDMLPMSHGVTASANLKVADQLTLNTPILWVNNLGNRFMSADLLKETTNFTTAVVGQGGYAYTIVDQKTVDRWTDTTKENTGTWVHYWDRFGIVDADGKPTIYHAPVDKETFEKDFETLTEAGEGIVANTLEEAAEFIGCDPETLKTTVENYNKAVETGVDEEFHTEKDDLVYSVEEGPFYVTKGHAGVLVALGGVNVTPDLEVLDNDNHIIKGLYAVGNNCSGVSEGVYSTIEGVGLGFALTSGRLAGATSAEYAASVK